ncbi:MAG TPA: serine hydrolase domain-containing protein [Longimicrobiales bacterium]|nr:serine hydrolase domain-containing protein [Longimicrobiales bacterium]
MTRYGGTRRLRRLVVAAMAAALVLVVLATLTLPLSGPPPPSPAEAPAPPPDPLELASGLVAAGVGTAYPGAALAVGRGGSILRVTATGRIGWRDASPAVIADSTRYDLASLTKAMATAVAVLLLVQDGVIGLDDPVQRHLPAFEGVDKARVTWRHLLTHTSGLPPGAAIRGATPAERTRRLLRTRLQTPPGRQVAYSDVGYVVLWAAAGRAAGEPLPGLLERRVWRPLGMSATAFSPGRDCEDCAPTLRLRGGEPFRGVPADALARQLGGVTGSAGLFSTAADVARFVAMVAAGGELDGVRVIDAALVREMLTQQPGAGRRTLGWTAFCPEEPPAASRPCERPVAYGHNGWTGTSIWLDPDSGHWAALLTNRSYERADRPFPLDRLRSELFLTVAGTAAEGPPARWLATDSADVPVAGGADTRPGTPPSRPVPAR